MSKTHEDKGKKAGKNRLGDTGQFSPEQQVALTKLANDLLDNDNSDKWKRDQGHLLDFLVDRARSGTDLSKSYPGLYKLLIKDSHLRNIFIDLVESIEAETAGESLEIPEIKESDLGFLNRKQPAEVSQTGPNSWRVLLQIARDELRKSYQPGNYALRSTRSEGESWQTLLRQDLRVDDEISVAFRLEIAPSPKPDWLELFASLATDTSRDAPEFKFQYQLHITWGSYEGSITVGDAYRAQLPSIPRAAIENPADTRDLIVSLDLERRAPA